jgi:hypothetical protein
MWDLIKGQFGFRGTAMDVWQASRSVRSIMDQNSIPDMQMNDQMTMHQHLGFQNTVIEASNS